ncbi:serine hydrolase [Nocardia sp. CC213A]|uniref:serine hydrolase domain-containing protein n=2 Tax=unclassified Nocardia TaxID=2637762 RepID=UPI00278C2FA2|nr:serine hydrolase domain-containing protein [Nocardia sp. CC213A]
MTSSSTAVSPPRKNMGTNNKSWTTGARWRAGATVLAAVLLAGTAGCANGPEAAAEPDRPELQKAIQAVVDAGYAGVQMRVHDQRGEWVGSAGVSKLGESAKPPTDGRFWAGSNAKTFTATLVLQLVAEGRVGLDDPVAGFLPELGVDPRITVRMLLQHTSGIFNYTGEYFADGSIVPGIPAKDKEWVDNRFHSYRPEELVRLALSKPLRFTPGTDQSYSNTNYTLAGLLIEKVTARPYAEEMQRRILGPLDLRGTVIPSPENDELPGPHAHGYYRYQDGGEWKVTDVARQNLSLLPAAGDIISTTQDLHTFFSALNSGELLPASLLSEMRTPHGQLGYGLGVFVEDLGPNCGGTVLRHNGSPPGGYGALMYSTPDGSKTLTASITTGDAAINPAVEYPKILERLLDVVFCSEQAAK